MKHYVHISRLTLVAAMALILASGSVFAQNVEQKKEHYLLPFALKTNALFDLAGAVNAQVEFPIGGRVSVAAELIHPWWLSKKNSWCYQGRSIHLEPRVWFGDRSKKEMLTGLFMSVYGGVGDYDFQLPSKGYQGKFWDAGIGIGYSWSMSRHWAFELEAGVGYFETLMDHYTPRHNYTRLVYDSTTKNTWIGPTRANASFVYRFSVNTYDKHNRNK